MGISLRHSGHFLVVGSAGAGALRMRVTSALIGVTTKKYTAAAISRNETTVLMKSPTGNTVLPTVKVIEEKSGLPTRAAMSGVSRSLVRAVTTPPKEAPITTPTAISITLPRRMNCLNPLSMGSSLGGEQLYGPTGGDTQPSLLRFSSASQCSDTCSPRLRRGASVRRTENL